MLQVWDELHEKATNASTATEHNVDLIPNNEHLMMVWLGPHSFASSYWQVKHGLAHFLRVTLST